MLWFNSHLPSSVQLLGGKGYHLAKLQSWGLKVPPFLVVTTECYKYWSASGELPVNLIQGIEKLVGQWSAEYFAVRSSMSLEDGVEDSFAGIMETYLYVKSGDLSKYIIQCFESMSSERVQEYVKSKNIRGEQVAAVVIQKMVFSEKSGVGFSRSPVGNSALVYVESAYGLGEGVVAGLVEVDQYYMDRFGDTVHEVINEKLTKVDLDLSAENHTSIQDVPLELKNESSLSEGELSKLHQWILFIEKKMECPCDIEWAIGSDKELYFLQVRAITQKFSELEYFVDTNLAESYPGTTSPLNADFVRRAYEDVFSKSFPILGFSKERAAEVNRYTPNLISYQSGHLYYHIYNYYAVFHALPSGKSAKEAWHKMIGGKIDHSIPMPQFKPWGFLEKCRYVTSVLKLVFFHKKIFSDLTHNVKKNINVLYAGLEKEDNPKKLIEVFFDVFQKDLGFAYTILNDYLIMINLKLMDYFIKKYDLTADEVSAIITPKHKFDSLKPLEALTKILALPELSQSLLEEMTLLAQEGERSYPSNPYALIYTRLKEKNYLELLSKIQIYLEEFGNRAFEELKLECLTFKQSPVNFFKLLEWQFANKSQAQSSVNDKQTKMEKPELDWDRFSLIDKRLLKILMSFMHQTVSTRENTRLLRTEIYGWVREILLKIFRQLRMNHSDVFAQTLDKDFFSLTFGDLVDYKSGICTESALAEKISLHKSWTVKGSQYPEFYCHPIGYPTCYFEEFSYKAAAVSESGSILQGMGAAPGILEAEPVILHTPQEAMSVKNIEDKILVTKSTDPAWIFILTKCKGLISEKGSLLSHTAIIGRELNKPTVVGVKNVTQVLVGAKKIRMNGHTGTIEILES
jgi:pyruvate,water dikinase